LLDNKLKFIIKHLLLISIFFFISFSSIFVNNNQINYVINEVNGDYSQYSISDKRSFSINNVKIIIVDRINRAIKLNEAIKDGTANLIPPNTFIKIHDYQNKIISEDDEFALLKLDLWYNESDYNYKWNTDIDFRNSIQKINSDTINNVKIAWFNKEEQIIKLNTQVSSSSYSINKGEIIKIHKGWNETISKDDEFALLKLNFWHKQVDNYLWNADIDPISIKKSNSTIYNVKIKIKINQSNKTIRLDQLILTNDNKTIFTNESIKLHKGLNETISKYDEYASLKLNLWRLHKDDQWNADIIELGPKKSKYLSISDTLIKAANKSNQTVILDKSVNNGTNNIISAGKLIKIHKGWNETISKDDEFALLNLSIWNGQTDDQWHADIDPLSIKKSNLTSYNVKIFDVDRSGKNIKLYELVEYGVNSKIPAKELIKIHKGWNETISKDDEYVLLKLKVWKKFGNYYADFDKISSIKKELIKLDNVKILYKLVLTSDQSTKIKIDKKIYLRNKLIINDNEYIKINGIQVNEINQSDEFVSLKLNVWRLHENDQWNADIIEVGFKKNILPRFENIKVTHIYENKEKIKIDREYKKENDYKGSIFYRYVNPDVWITLSNVSASVNNINDTFNWMEIKTWENNNNNLYADIILGPKKSEILELENVEIIDIDSRGKKIKLNKEIVSINDDYKIGIGKWIDIKKNFHKLSFSNKIIPKHTLVKKLSLKIWENSSNTDIWNADIIDLEVQILKSLDLKNVKINYVEDQKISLNQDIPINETYTISNNTLFEIYSGLKNKTIVSGSEYTSLRLNIWEVKNEYYANISWGHEKSKIIKLENIKLNSVSVSTEKKSIALNKKIIDKIGDIDFKILEDEEIEIHEGWDETFVNDNELALLNLKIWKIDDSFHADILLSLKKSKFIKLNNIEIIDVVEEDKKIKINKENIDGYGKYYSDSWIILLDIEQKKISKCDEFDWIKLRFWENNNNLCADIILGPKKSKIIELKNVNITSIYDQKIKLDQQVIGENNEYKIFIKDCININEGWNKLILDSQIIPNNTIAEKLSLKIWKIIDLDNNYIWSADIVAFRIKILKSLDLENIKINSVEDQKIKLNQQILVNDNVIIHANSEIKIYKGWNETFIHGDEFALLNLKIWQTGKNQWNANIEASIKKEEIFIKDVEIIYIGSVIDTSNLLLKLIEIKLDQSIINNNYNINKNSLILINKANWDESIKVKDEFDPLVLNIWVKEDKYYADYIEDKSIKKRNISESEEGLKNSNSEDDNEETEEPKNPDEDNNEKTELLNDLNNDKIKLKEINKTSSFYITWKLTIITIFVSIIIIFLIIFLLRYILKIRKKKDI
jgi:hypothetical protein